MGDRGNIKVREANGNSIYIYGHWMGHEMPKRLQEALIFAKDRWNDESYLTRTLITEVCKGARDATGYGVSTYPTDNEYDVMEVESDSQVVRVLDKTGFHDEKRNWEKDQRKIKAEWTFEEYCALPMEDDPWAVLRKAPVPQ